jgi:hypothetical protein
MGVSPKRLTGWEPTESQVARYADPIWWKPGTWRRLLGFEVIRESEWDRESLDLVLAHLAAEAEKGPHGIPMSRATRKGAKFIAPTMPTHDLAQKALAKAQKAYYDANPDAIRDGDLWGPVEEIID